MVRRAARHNQDAPKLLPVFHLQLQFGELDAAVGLESAAQGVAHGFGLLQNLLDHEVFVPAFFGGFGRPCDFDRRAFYGRAVQAHQAHGIARHDAHIAVFEQDHAPCVGQQRGDVGGDKVFAVAQPNHQRRVVAGDHHAVGVVHK
jgi:hypothetical protein